MLWLRNCAGVGVAGCALLSGALTHALLVFGFRHRLKTPVPSTSPIGLGAILDVLRRPGSSA